MNKRSMKFLAVALLGVIAVANALAATPFIDPSLFASAAVLGGAPIMIGNTELVDLLTKQGTAFEEFKRTNDERLKQIESKGSAPADFEVKLGKINDDLTELGKQIADVAKKSNRPQILDAKGNPMSDDEVAHKSAFETYFRKGIEGDLRALEQKTLHIGSDPDGGYFVPTEVSNMITRVAEDEVAMRRLASVITIGSNSYKMPVVTAGTTGGWRGETSETTETGTPTIGELEFVPGELYAEPWSTNNMLEDATINVGAWLADEVSTTFVEMEGEAFVSGSGINRPRGILSYTTVANASYAWGKVGYIASGNAGAWAASDPSNYLIDLVHSLRRKYRGNAAFLMNDLTLASIRKLKDGQGNYIWQPGLQAGVADRLLGYGVEIDDNMPDIAANSLSIAFGDFKRGYQVVDRRGISVIRDNLTKKGWTKFYTTKRVGGGIKNFEAIKLMKFAAS